MKLICLIENTAVDDKLYSENGLSFFVEFGGKNYVIDAGLTAKAAENARRMQLPTDSLDAVVLTHNHTAHVGGIDAFMRLSPRAEIYMREGARRERFVKNGLFKEPAGAGKGFFNKYAENLTLFNRFSEVAEGFYLTSCEVFDEKNVNPDRSCFTLEGRKQIPYDFSDECFAVLFPKKRKADGLVIVGGCFHCGVHNMLDTVQENWPGIPILAIIGGFHFMGSNPKNLGCSADYVASQARALKLSSAEKIYACHCTGFKGFDLMDEILGDRLMYIGGGEEVDI